MIHNQPFSLEPILCLGKDIIYDIFYEKQLFSVNYESGYWFKLYCYREDLR